MNKVGLSLFGVLNPEERIPELKDAGINCFEISPFKNKDYSSLISMCKENGLTPWSAHLPFDYNIDISSLEGTVSDDTVKLFMELMEAVAPYGIKVFVLHPSSEPIDDSIREKRMEMAISKLKVLAEKADELGAVIAVEDLPRTCLGRNSQEMLRLISADPRLRICFDTNHLLGEPIEEFIENCGSKIITTHISDYDFVDERHLLPGEGDIDWVSVADSLDKIGYTGPYMYELGYGNTRNIERPVDLCAKDFKENFMCIMKREELPLHGGKLLYK